MTYCFKCNECYAEFESVLQDQKCPNNPRHDVRRDYRAEAAGVNVAALRADRQDGLSGVKTEYI